MVERFRPAAAAALGIAEPGRYPLAIVLGNEPRLIELSAATTRGPGPALERNCCGLRIFRQKMPRPTRCPRRFAAELAAVLGQACAMCQGRCCGYGDNAAYLRAGTIRRYRAAHPEKTASDVVDDYLSRLANHSVAESCIYHQANGCGLSREMRSETCNRHFCKGLKEFRQTVGESTPVQGFFAIVHNGVVDSAAFIDATGTRFAPVARPTSRRYNSPMQRATDVLIIGGGVIGLTTAYFLGTRRRSSAPFSTDRPPVRKPPGLVPESSRPEIRCAPFRNTTAFAPRVRGPFRHFRKNFASKPASTTVTASVAASRSLNPAATRRCTLWASEGIEFERIDDVKKLEPEVRLRYPTAFHLPGMAQVRNPWHLRALIAACGKVGVKIDPNVAARAFRTHGTRVTGVCSADGTEYPAGRILVASGAWSDRLLGSLNCETGVHPVRGQIILFRTNKPILRRIIDVGKRYIVPREDGRVLGWIHRRTGSGLCESEY